MMTTKFIIELDHHRPNDTDLYYYRGEAGSSMEKTVPMFDYRKKLAKRYKFEHEAIRDMQILKVMHRKEDTFRVIPVRCRA